MVSLKVGDSILVTKPGGKPRVEVVVQLYDSKNSLGEVHNKVVFKEGPDDHLDVADLQLDTIMLLTPVQAPPTTPAVSPPSSAPDSQTLFRSPEELLRAYPIVLMFRLGSKDRARFERRYLNMLDYERFFEALIPDHRHYLQFLRSTLDELEAKNLVRSGDHSISIGRFAVLPVGGNTGDKLGENFLILQQEGGPLVWLGKLATDIGKETLKVVIKAMKQAWDDSQDFELDHAEVRARGLPGTVKIPLRGIDIHQMHRPEGSLIHFLACLQDNFPTMRTLNPPPASCVEALGCILCSFEN